MAGYGDYCIAPETAGEIMTVLYQRHESGFSTGNKPVARLFGWQESTIRRAKKFYAWGYTKMMDISRIRRDGGTQARAEIPKDVKAHYRQLMESGHRFPPVIVFYDGTNHWLADGFIRTETAEDLGLTQIDVDVRQGELRDAILYSFEANARHGCPPTMADRRRAAMRMLQDPEWMHWSDRQIARQCGIGSHHTVAAYRKETARANCPDATNQTRIYLRDGQIVPFQAGTEGEDVTESTVAVVDDEPTEEAEEWISTNGYHEENECPEDDGIEETGCQDPEQISFEPLASEYVPPSEPSVIVAPEPKDVCQSVSLATPIPKAPTIKKNQRSDDWIRGCRVYGELTDQCIEKFKEEAAFYRDMHRTFQKFQERIAIVRNRYHSNEPQAGDKLAGPFVARAIVMATTADPRDWQPCMNCRNDALMSCGRIRGRICSVCRGFGFTLNATPERVEIGSD